MFDLNLKFIVEFFSGLLTPAIGIITTYIAIQQYKTNRLKLRLELYPRQLEVYESVMKIFAVVNQTGRLEYEDVSKFWGETKENLFLFEKDVHQHIERIYEKGIDFAAASEPGTRINDNERKKIMPENRIITLVRRTIADNEKAFQQIHEVGIVMQKQNVTRSKLPNYPS